MHGCQWEEIKLDERMPPSRISPNLYEKQITEASIIKGITNGALYGFLVVDIKPTPIAAKFEEMNWPPLFVRDEIDFKMLPQWMQAGRLDKPFPRSTLVQTMKADKILLHSKLLQFYLKNGFRVTKVYKFVEYQPGKCFSKFYDTLYQLRVKATIENNTAQATAIKLTGNSPYGKVDS